MQPPSQPAGTFASELQPVATIALPNDAAGSTVFGTMQIDGTNQILYVRHPASSVDWWARAKWHSPDAALLSIPITLLVLLMALHRFIRRPQRPGRKYCAGCNYDLTPSPITAAQPTPISPARCPECGVETANRPPIRGRFAIRRFGPIVAIALVALIAAGAIIASHIQRPTPGLMANSPWPMPIIGNLIPALQFTKSPLDFGNGFTLTAYSIKTGTLIATPITRHDAIFQEPALAGDGGMLALSIFESGTTDGYRLYVSRVKGGVPGPAQPLELSPNPIPSTISHGLTAFQFSSQLADGSRWLYLHRASSPLSQGANRFRTELLRVRINADGSQSLFETIATYAPPVQLDTGRGASIPYHRWLIHEADPTQPDTTALHFSLFIDAAAPSATATTRDALVVAFEPWTTDAPTNTARSMSREITVSYPGTSFFNPRITNDGRVFQFKPYASTASMKVDLITGTVTETIRTSTGPQLSIDHLGWILGNARNIEDNTGTIIATVAGGGTWTRPSALSQDGRLAAGFSFSTSGRGWWNQLGIGPWGSGEVLIWDMSQAPGWKPSERH